MMFELEDSIRVRTGWLARLAAKGKGSGGRAAEAMLVNPSRLGDSRTESGGGWLWVV